MAVLDDLLRDLEQYEEDAVSKFDVGMVGGVDSPEKKKETAKKLFQIESDGRLYQIPEWGNAITGISILWQLLYQAHLIVDIRPLPENEFMALYGVTPLQMKILAEQGFITPNLYEFESDRLNKFSKHHSSVDTIKPLLFNAQTHCRINSIRRRCFLEKACPDHRYNDLIEEGKSLFSPGLKAMPGGARKALTLNASLSEAVMKVASNWAYVVSLGASVPETSNWIRHIRANLPKSMKITDDLKSLMAHEVLVACPYTASLGGTHNMPKQELNVVLGGYGHLRPVSKREISSQVIHDAHVAAGLDFLCQIGMKRIMLETCEPLDTAYVPSVPSTSEFNNYIAFLKDNRPLLNEAESLFDDVRKLAKSKKIAIDSIKGYIRIYELIAGEKKKINSRYSRAIGRGVGGAIGLASLSLGHIPLNSCTTMLAVGLGAMLIGAAGAIASEMNSTALNSDKRRIVGFFSKLNTWKQP